MAKIPSLEEVRVKMYEKHDYTKLIAGIGIAIGLVFLVIAVLNMTNQVDMSFKGLDNQDRNEDGVIDALDINPGYDIDGDGVPDQGESPTRRFLNFLVFAILAFIGPIGFYKNKKMRDIKAIERRLPDFLRDVAEAGRFGMTLADAIVVSSRGRYGKLTPEIEKMASQIQWGVPATEALRLFTERVKTPMVGRIVSIIRKSSDAGGNVADVLSMVSHDAKENQLTEDERKIAMSTYIAVIYISFLVFLITIWILNVSFLPKMKETSTVIEAGQVGGEGEFQSPLAENIDVLIAEIQTAFFISAIIHAVGDGLLAGVLDNGKIVNGLRHSFIMLIIGFLLLLLV
ncbi:MAG: type II secretion system F family protein [Methanomassiliicoccales archaeon]|nr:MAG: type II secretion system F family protein [Methanomassiliicoccales archaeon]